MLLGFFCESFLLRADLLALLCVMFTCVFVAFPYGVPGRVWYLIVCIPDLCLLFNLVAIISNPYQKQLFMVVW